MSMTVERRTKSTVRTEYSASLSAKRENRPRLIIGAPRDSAAPFKTVRREIISGQSNTARFAGKKTGTLWRALALRSGETRSRMLPATLRHYAEMTSRSAAVAHALLRAASSLTRRLGALEQRASAKVPTRHARVRAPRPPVIQCEVILASALSQDWPPRIAARRKLRWRSRRGTLVDVQITVHVWRKRHETVYRQIWGANAGDLAGF